MSNAFKFLVSIAGYTFHFLNMALFAIVIAPISIPLSVIPGLSYKFISLALRMYLLFLTRIFLPGLQIYRISEMSGFERLPNRPVVLVANHHGKLDGPLLLGKLKRTGVLIKSKYARYFRRPVYHSLVKKFDFIAVDSQSSDVMNTALKRCRELLLSGRNLLVFPEGMRSSTDRILPYRDFAFKIALDLKVDIVPIVIFSTYPFMIKNLRSYFPPRKFIFAVRCIEMFKHEDYDSPSLLAADVRTKMIQTFKEMKKEYGIIKRK